MVIDDERTCECGHYWTMHKDKGGNSTWDTMKFKLKDCGVGGCFNIGCKCKVFGQFDEDVKKIREVEKKKKRKSLTC